VKCPDCGAQVLEGEARPARGDVMFCTECCEVSTLCECGLHLRPAYDHEVSQETRNKILEVQMRASGAIN